MLADISAASSAIAMEPEKFERTGARDIAEVVVSERKADVALLAAAYYLPSVRRTDPTVD